MPFTPKSNEELLAQYDQREEENARNLAELEKTGPQHLYERMKRAYAQEKKQMDLRRKMIREGKI